MLRKTIVSGNPYFSVVSYVVSAAWATEQSKDGGRPRLN